MVASEPADSIDLYELDENTRLEDEEEEKACEKEQAERDAKDKTWVPLTDPLKGPISQKRRRPVFKQEEKEQEIEPPPQRKKEPRQGYKDKKRRDYPASDVSILGCEKGVKRTKSNEGYSLDHKKGEHDEIKPAATARELIFNRKEHLVAFLEDVLPVDARDYAKQVQMTGVDEWVAQFREKVIPLYRLGKMHWVIQHILKTVKIQEKDLGTTPEESRANLKLFERYLTTFAKLIEEIDLTSLCH